MASPSITQNATGNVANAASVAGNGNNTYALDFSAKFGAWVYILYTTGGTVQAANGLKCEVMGGYGATPTYDTLASVSYQFAALGASLSASIALYVPIGKWQLKLTNIDTANAVTITVTTSTVDAVA